VGDLRAGTPAFYGQVTGTWAASDDYEDGAGETVHSEYQRWSANAALGWTPDDGTRLELTGARSDGEAAYADRTMDGVAFDRDNVGLRFEREFQSPHLKRLEARAYYNYVDHVMDNYSLRSFTPTATMPFDRCRIPTDARRADARDRSRLGAAATATVGRGPAGEPALAACHLEPGPATVRVAGPRRRRVVSQHRHLR